MIKAIIFDYYGVITTDQSYRLEHEALIDYIRHLRGNHFKTAILSNSGTGLYAEAQRYHLDNLFELILCSEEAGVGKPNPRIYEMALDRLGVQPHEAVFVDDSDSNVRGAEAVGISGILYTGLADLRSDLIRRGLDSPAKI